MIEETIQKLTASIDALTVQLSKLQLPRSTCATQTTNTTGATVIPAPVAEAAPASEAEAPKPKKAKKPTLVEAPLDAAAAPAPAPEPAAPTPPPEPKLPEQKDVIDIAGQLLVATNQNDGGFLKALAKELGLDKLRNAKPEQRQAVDRAHQGGD